MSRYINMEDFELVRSFLDDGAEEAFAQLLTRYKNLVYSIVLRMVNDRDDANDLAQEVFIKAYRHLDKYSPEFRFSTWITSIATNHVIDHRRRKRLATTLLEDICEGGLADSMLVDCEKTPEQSLITNETMGEIRKSIESLPEIYRVPLLMFHQSGFSYQEISKAIDEPISKVKNRLFRGRRMLRMLLEKIQTGVQP